MSQCACNKELEFLFKRQWSFATPLQMNLWNDDSMSWEWDMGIVVLIEN